MGQARPESDVPVIDTKLDVTGICASIATIKMELQQAEEHKGKKDDSPGAPAVDESQAAARLLQLASQFHLSAAWQEMQNHIRVSLQETLDKRYCIAELNTDWRSLPDSRKEEIARDIIDTMCAIQEEHAQISVPSPRLVLFNLPKSEKGVTSFGFHSGDYKKDPGTYELKLNTHYAAKLWSSFPQLLDTLTHENTHHLQMTFQHYLHTGEMSKQDPLIQDVVIFKTIEDKDAYIPYKYSEEAYRAQVLEADAWSFGTSMLEFAESHGTLRAEFNPFGMMMAGAAMVFVASTMFMPQPGRAQMDYQPA